MIAICGNDCQDTRIPDIEALFGLLARQGEHVAVHSPFAAYLSSRGAAAPAPFEALPPEATMLLSIGGDGTFLRTATLAGDSDVPVLGINTGHLGYLAAFSLDRPLEISEACRGTFTRSPRLRLALECGSMPHGFCPVALNEIAIAKGDSTQMLSIEAYADGRFIADYRADGLLVSTPTGSTAYNLSCGGPILEPTVRNLILTPVAPHSLTLRPLVLGADVRLDFRIESRAATCNVGLDGRTFAIPARGASLTVRPHPRPLCVALPPGSDFARTLRAKLAWGTR